MPEVYTLGQTPITCHAFNANRSREYHLPRFPFVTGILIIIVMRRTCRQLEQPRSADLESSG